MLGRDLNASLERYARYYEHVHGDSVDVRALIPEILRAFFEVECEFQSWSRSSGKGWAAHAPTSTAAPRSNSDCHRQKVG
jgi:hypothetical protein